MPGLFDVSQEVILVTGASQGLGRQFAACCPPWRSVALAARQTAKLKSLEMIAPGGRAVAVQMDVTDPPSIAARSTAPKPPSAGQRLINNAGIAIENSRSTDRGGLGCRHQRQPEGRLFRGDRTGAAHDRAQAGGQYRQRRLGARLRRDEVPLALHHLQGGDHPGHQIDGAGTGGQPHPRQCAGAGLYRHRDEPRILGHARAARSWPSGFRSATSAPNPISTAPSCCWPPAPRAT